MSTLIIRKKSLKTWLHTDSILGDFIISKFYFNADNGNFQVVEQGQSKRVIYDVTDITLYDDTDGGVAETFANITALSLRLEELNYPAFQYDGQIVSIANLIDAGTNVTITGDGTEASPYVISSSGGGGGAVTSVNSDTGAVIVDLESVLTEGDRSIKTIADFAPYTFVLGDEAKFLQDTDGETKTIPPDVFTVGSVLKIFSAVSTIDILEGAGVNIYAGGTPSDQTLEIGELAIITLIDTNNWVFNKIGYKEIPAPITIDATPTDGSSNAVSSNGVFDALALRTKIVIKQATPSSAVTGTTTETILSNNLIPGGTFSTNDIMNLVSFRAIKTGANGTVTYKIYINTTSNTLSGAVEIRRFPGASIYTKVGNFTYTITGGNLRGYGFTDSGVNAGRDGGTASLPEGSTSFNPANDIYIICTAQLANGLDSVIQRELLITN
jgi:hypothetical protein